MSILIGCDSFLSLRNVRNGDLGRKLEGEQLVVLVDPNQYVGSTEVAPPGAEVRCLLDFDVRKEPDLLPLVNRAYWARKSYYDPLTHWQRVKFACYSRNRSNPIRRVASLLRGEVTIGYYWLAGRRGRAQSWRQQLGDAFQAHSITEEYQCLLEDLGADVVASFSPEGLREMALIESARKMGLPTAVMIRSLDNLSAKIQHLPDADAYLVWSEATRDFLLYMYPELAANQVHVTGSPQFDHHLDPSFRLAREEFFGQLGLDPNRPLVVYTCATPGLIPHEIEIAQHLADAVHNGKLVQFAQLLVRGHPRMFGSNFPLLHRTYPGVAVYPTPSPHTYQSSEHEAAIIRLILEDEPMHLSVLAYQDVQVNVSGTMIVDSAILDKPVIGIYYDIPANTPSSLSTRRFYRRSDMRPIVSSGGLRLAHSPEECITLINHYLTDPTEDAYGRQKIRERECGPIGNGGENIATILRSLLR